MKQPRNQQAPKQVTTLCVDPGFSVLGWGITHCGVGEATIQSMGVIRTAASAKKMKVLKSSDSERRIREIAVGLSGLITRHEVDIIVYESFSMPQKSPKSAVVKIGLPYGVLGALSVVHALPCVQSTPQAVKKALCGKANASKDEVEQATRSRFAGGGSDAAIAQFERMVAATYRNHAWDALSCYFAAMDSDVMLALRRSLRVH